MKPNDQYIFIPKAGSIKPKGKINPKYKKDKDMHVADGEIDEKMSLYKPFLFLLCTY
jgi:hypothetical protein